MLGALVEISFGHIYMYGRWVNIKLFIIGVPTYVSMYIHTCVYVYVYHVQSSKLLLALTSTVILGFGHRRDPWQYFVLFTLLRVLKWGLVFEERRGVTTTSRCV
jgi:hypothetical protein